MKQLGLLTVFVIFGSMVQAQEMSLVGVEKVVIVSPFAQVSLVSGAVPMARATGSNQLSWSSRMDGKILRIIGSASSGTKMNAAVKVDVIGPGLPVEIHLAEGAITGHRWTQSVMVDLLKGKIAMKDCKSSVTGLLQNGNASFIDHQGTVRLELFRGDVLAKTFTGDLEISGYKTDVVVDKFQGLINIHQHQGGDKITNSAGTLRFDNAKATVAAIGFNGRVDGQTAEGYVNIQAGSEPEIQIRTQTGKVSVSAPGSGAMVSAHNEEGEITGPSSMRVEKDKGARVLRGRLKGTDKGGRIELTSLAGALVIRE